MNDDRKFFEKKAWLLLLLQAGMPADVLEKVLGISSATAISYVKKITLSGEWKGNVTFLPDARPIMLKLYADIKWGEKKGIYTAAFKEKLMLVLAELLEEEKIIEIINFTLPAITSFSRLQYVTDVPLGYQNLLEALRIWDPFQPSGWGNYLYHIASGEIPLPQPKEFYWGKKHFLHDILQRSADETRYWVAPILTTRICQQVDATLAELTYKEATVLTMLFGLKADPKTEEQIGIEFDLTRERIRQIKEKAMRHLKVRFLRLQSIGDAWETIESLKETYENKLKTQKDEFIQKLYTLDHPEEVAPIIISQFDLLIMKVDYIDFSVRLLNCLKAADVEYLWQLVMLSEGALLKFRNFGKKSLIELKEYMKQKNIHFNWNFSPAEIVQLELETTQKM